MLWPQAGQQAATGLPGRNLGYQVIWRVIRLNQLTLWWWGTGGVAYAVWHSGQTDLRSSGKYRSGQWSGLKIRLVTTPPCLPIPYFLAAVFYFDIPVRCLWMLNNYVKKNCYNLLGLNDMDYYYYYCASECVCVYVCSGHFSIFHQILKHRKCIDEEITYYIWFYITTFWQKKTITALLPPPLLLYTTTI